jgi:hypothetical protein
MSERPGGLDLALLMLALLIALACIAWAYSVPGELAPV